MLYVFTTCALNFVPCAKLLARSVEKHLPDAKFVFVLTDEKPEDFNLEDEGLGEVLYLEDFQEELGNPRGWAFGHTIMELATAIKPFTAAKLMERSDCDAVMFFDPDCVLFGDLADLRQAIKEHSVVLTPHASELHVDKDWLFFEMNPLKVGSFNLGYFGFQNNNTGRAVAHWWRYRLKELCMIDPDRGLFTDQKWMDLLPGYIDDIKVMREPVYNIARWNTFQRKITKQGDTYLANGSPVEFIHFSGFYKIGPYVQGLYDKSSEPLIEEDSLEVLQELSLWYSEQLADVRTQAIYSAPWPFGLYKNGEEISEADRRRYRNSLELQEKYPDPFSTNSLDSYWLHCRKAERVEEEKAIKKLYPQSEVVNRSVHAHNSILRKMNSALEEQLAQTSAELVDVRNQSSSNLKSVQMLKELFFVSAPRLSDDAILRALDPLLSSGAFNGDKYLDANPDVRDAGFHPLVHYVRYGIAEGRNFGDTGVVPFFEANIDVFSHVVFESLKLSEMA